MSRPQDATGETPPFGKVVLRPLLEEGDALCLVAGYAVQSPGKQSHPFSQHELQVPLWREATEYAVAVLLPILFLLHPGTTGAGDRIPCRIAFHFTTSLPSWVAGPPLT